MGSYECGRSPWCCSQCSAWFFVLSPALAWNIGANLGVTMFDICFVFAFGVAVWVGFCFISSLWSLFVRVVGLAFSMFSTAVTVLVLPEFLLLLSTPVHSEA